MHQLMHASMRCSCCIPSHTLWTLRVCLSEPAPLDSEHSASPMCASAAAVKPIGPWRLCSMQGVVVTCAGAEQDSTGAVAAGLALGATRRSRRSGALRLPHWPALQRQVATLAGLMRAQFGG